jgi:hypothetical protein
VTNRPGGEIRGGSSVQAPLENAGGLVRATGTGILTISNLTANASGGELRVDDGATLQVTSDFASDGTIVLAGPNANLSGGQITNTGTIRGHGRINNLVQNDDGGTIRAEGGTLTLAAQTFRSDGRIEAGPGAEILFVQGLTLNTGQIALTGGGFDNNNQRLALNNTGAITGFGTIRTGGLDNFRGTISVGGVLDVLGPVYNGGTVSTPTDTIIRFFGPVTGPGSYVGAGTVMFLDTFSPGESPAAVHFGGDLALSPAGELVIELGGTAPGAAHDQIRVAGDLTLGGKLSIELLNSLSPTVGQVFNILDWGRLSGEFDSIELPPLAGPLAWNTSRLYTDGLLSLVLPGDFNTDGSVNAADYVVWRNGLGTAYTQNDFNSWRANFGISLAESALNPQSNVPAVPEPHTWMMSLVGSALLAWFGRKLSRHPHTRIPPLGRHRTTTLALFTSMLAATIARADLVIPDYVVAEPGFVPEVIVVTQGQSIDVLSAANFDLGLINNGVVHGPTAADEFLTFTGFVQGAGDYTGNIAIDGIFRPGNSPAVTQFGGNLSFGPASMLEIELAGTEIGEFDRSEVAGNVSLAGSLSVVLLSPFTLSLGNSFEIIDVGGTQSGQFAGLNEGSLVGNFGDIDLFITYAGGDGNDVTIFAGASAVPEARAWLMLCAVSIGAVGVRVIRRRVAALDGLRYR